MVKGSDDSVFVLLQAVHCRPAGTTFLKPLTLDVAVRDGRVWWWDRAAVREEVLREYQVPKHQHRVLAVCQFCVGSADATFAGFTFVFTFTFLCSLLARFSPSKVKMTPGRRWTCRTSPLCGTTRAPRFFELESGISPRSVWLDAQLL